ncbi:LytR C-terminal domain-containing protein [Zafaria sp. Z1313]|uniref:LytR C-terminal domain-containing protein n=1 Tax=Zafaria sp. Z1313 TaxID=3423202 RepID=UPI003D302F66
MSKYPSDEFDRVPEFAERQGVHRADVAGTRPGRSGLALLLGVGLLALLVGVFSFTILPQFVGQQAAAPGSGTSAPGSTGAAESTDEGNGAGDGPTDSADPSDAEPGPSDATGEPADESTDPADPSDEGSEPADPSGEPTDEASETPSVVDRSLAVGVYNGSGRGGLAASGAATVRGAGFTSVSASNWVRQEGFSAVYYRTDSSRATAEQVAAALGITTVFQTENIPVEISAVLGSNYGR